MLNSLSLDAINTLAAIILLTDFMLVASSRMRSLTRIFAIQSLALGALAAVVAFETGAEHIYIVAVLSIVLKAVIIPRFINYATTKIQVKREVEPLVKIPGSLLICAAITLLAYFVTEPLMQQGTAITSNCLAISFASVLIGMFLMVSRRKAITEVIGLLVVENGVFLAAISTTYSMPMIVELGVFFDVLVGVIIMGLFAFRINRTFDSIDASILRGLKD
ncbi:MAG TPA: hydrogenase [Methanomassiliicoccales archaeon]|nr:hydrogenase [Methanomassiliicoccales archaeon]